MPRVTAPSSAPDGEGFDERVVEPKPDLAGEVGLEGAAERVDDDGEGEEVDGRENPEVAPDLASAWPSGASARSAAAIREVVRDMRK